MGKIFEKARDFCSARKNRIRDYFHDFGVFGLYFAAAAMTIVVIVFLFDSISENAEERIVRDVIRAMDSRPIAEREIIVSASIPQAIAQEYKDCPSVISLKILFIMQAANEKLPGEEKALYLKQILESSKKFDISPLLLAALIARESNFRPKAVSSAGALGLSQVIPKWHRAKLKARGVGDSGLFNPSVSIDVGAEALKEYLDSSGGDYVRALLKYVGGDRFDYIRDIFDYIGLANAAASDMGLHAVCGKL